MSSPTKRRRIAAVIAVGATAVAILWRTVAAVQSGTWKRFDKDVRRRFRSIRNEPCDVASQFVTAVSAPLLLVPANCVAAYALRHRGRGAWLPVAAAPFIAMTAGAIFTATFPQQYAPDSTTCEPCFPSGHTTGMTAEVATVAYVLVREKVLGRWIAVLPLGAAAVGGLNRLYRDRHWATDIIAGWSAGIAVASCCALLSELIAL